MQYRVSGLIFGSDGQSLAIVERSQGGSVLVGVGDELDDGRLIEIGESFVRVRFTGEDLLLPLSGGPALIAPSASSSLLRPNEHAPGIHGVLSDQLLVELDGIRKSFDSPQGSTQCAQAAFSEQLRDLIDLPAGTVIKNINGEAFTSVAEGVGLLEALLRERALIRLEFVGDESYEPIYFQP